MVAAFWRVFTCESGGGGVGGDAGGGCLGVVAFWGLLLEACAVALGVLEWCVRSDFDLDPRRPDAAASVPRGGARSSGIIFSAREAAR
jgi:hypothetical protein|mmetsp:Transcript_19881/g.33564  ORF Transcript_19881/g.33564 Transcript_19881/m.33564 type:complete len:88 (+) Transcript_19881:821-1084(+)